MRTYDKKKKIDEANLRLEEKHMGNKPYIKLNIRLRVDSGAIEPSYNENEVLDMLLNDQVKFESTNNGTIFLLDKAKTNKIIGVIE